MNKDYYQILNVDKSASQDEIKKSYRKLAKQYHPDANPGQNTDAKMKEINLAYDTLSDPNKRQQYDQFGSNPQSQYTYQSNQSGYYDPMAEFFEEILRQQQRQSQNYSQNTNRQQPYRTVRFSFGKFIMYMFLFNFVMRLLFGF